MKIVLQNDIRNVLGVGRINALSVWLYCKEDKPPKIKVQRTKIKDSEWGQLKKLYKKFIK